MLKSVLEFDRPGRVLSLGLAAPAHAGATTLVSPELSVLGSDVALCRIVNVGVTPIAVKIQLRSGANLAREENVSVPPGDSKP